MSISTSQLKFLMFSLCDKSSHSCEKSKSKQRLAFNQPDIGIGILLINLTLII